MMDRSFLRRYAASGAVIAGLYLLNRFLLVPLTSCRLLAWHGADFLAGGLMPVSYTHLTLPTTY